MTGPAPTEQGRRPRDHEFIPPWPTARLTGPRPTLDRRVAIQGGGCVDIALADRVAAASYVQPSRWRCRVARTPLRLSGDAAAMATSELLFGEGFELFEVQGDWGYGRNPADRYGGWVPCDTLAVEDEAPPGQCVTARAAPVFALPDIKAPVLFDLPFGAIVAGVPDGRFLALAEGGFVHGAHLAAMPASPVAVARLFLGAPYVWGGRTPLGVDCSGLVQAALAATGRSAPRDSDQQQAALGRAVDFDERAAGDLVFFAGHVGILAAPDVLLHANAHWMAVVEEPLGDVTARGAAVLAVRRL